MKLSVKTGIVSAGVLIGVLFIIGSAVAQEARYVINTGSEQKQHSAYQDSLQADNLYFDAVKASMKRDDKEAENLYLQFTRMRPDVAAAYYELARINKGKNNDQSLTYITKAISLDNTNKWYKSFYGDLLATTGKYAEAAGVFEQLAKVEYFNNDYLLKAALYYEHAKKYKESINNLDKLIQKTGEDEDLLLQKEGIYLKMNDVESAGQILRQLIAQNPKEGKYYVLLGELYDSNNLSAKADEIFNKGQRLLPNDPAIQLGLAEHYRKNKDTAGYEKYVEKTIINKKLDAETQLSLLLPYLQSLGNDSTRKNEALSIAMQLAGQHPADAQVLGVYGDILLMNNETGKAAEQYKKSIAIDPSKFAVWQQLLYSYTEKNDADSLIKYAQKAMKLFPNQALVHYLYGIGEMNKKDNKNATKAINRAIELEPDENPQLLAQMYALLGDIYNALKEYDLSDSTFKKALQLEPNNPTTLNNYGYALSERGKNLDEAEKMSGKSLELRANEPTFLDTYGWILYKEGKYEDAKTYIQKAIDLNPANTDATVYEHMGDIYSKLNNKGKAVEYWLKAKEKGSENPELNKKIQER